MHTEIQILALITFFIGKHFIADFLLEFPYQWQNKGTYAHPGGIIHAVIHGVFTFIGVGIFPGVPLEFAFICASIDMIIHYHIDWLKMNANEFFGWSTNTHNEFWILLGLDQFLHYLTYMWITYLVITNK